MNEHDRTVARCVAKALIRELSASLYGSGANTEECARAISRAVKAASMRTGISELWLKSFIYRLSTGRE